MTLIATMHDLILEAGEHVHPMNSPSAWKRSACVSIICFAACAAPLSAQTAEQVEQYFKAYVKLYPDADANGDGKLTHAEYVPHAAKREKAEALKQVADRVKLIEDVPYATVGETTLKLDLYVPKEIDPARKPPLVVWVHGGGWHELNKDRCLIIWLAAEGYAVASVQYRLAPGPTAGVQHPLAPGQAHFPAQIHDCKGAVRWLRAHAQEYGYDPSRVGAAGESAGGHLSMLLGVSAGVEVLEGDVGGNTDQPSRVDAVVNFYGPGDLLAMGQELKQPDFLTFLFGGPVSQTRDQHIAASPINHITPDDAPILTLHGDKDVLVLLSQSRTMEKRYRESGLEYTLHVVEGAGHTGPQFTDAARRQRVLAFFNKHLRRR